MKFIPVAGIGLFAVSLLALAFSATAKPALRDNTQVTSGLIAVGIALEIDKNCDEISARKLKGLAFLSNLKRLARAQGYSSEEIESFVDSKTEKARLEERAREILAEKGATGSAGQAYCAVGKAEIASGSPAGGLLRLR